MTADGTGFRVRLRARIGKGFSTDETSLSFPYLGREVTLTEHLKKPLREAKWISLVAHGFDTEEAALSFGKQLRVSWEVVALAAWVGTDTGTDRVTQWISEDWARASGLIKEGDRLLPNIHGIIVMPDDDRNRVPFTEATATVTMDPSKVIQAFTDLPQESDLSLPSSINGIRLLNYAVMAREPLAQLVLALSAIEEMGQDERWSSEQRNLLEELAAQVENRSPGDAALSEISEAIRKLHRVSLRQGVKRLVGRLGMSSVWREWDRIYAARSQVFHGTAIFTESELTQLAHEAIKLCAAIVFKVAEFDGLRTPAVARENFGVHDEQIA